MKTKDAQEQPESASHPVMDYPLSKLHFDLTNPRYGTSAGSLRDESQALDLIVESFGVDDLLSSMAVNGFFQSEPLVGLKLPQAKGIRIVEGNRRLAACLILAKDPRAKNQKRRQEAYSALRAKHGAKSVDPVPVIVYSGADAWSELLPYLGVRHIVGSTDWDSYAKAHWVAQVIKKGDLKLDDIVQMIGDDNRTAARMLGGYYLVNQLKKEGRFRPKDSFRKGRGSNSEFPFSWVYTALDYSPVCEWIGFPASFDKLKENPIPPAKLDNAEWLLTFLFGNKSKKVRPAIEDSRDIGDLATVIGDAEQVLALKRGKSISEAIQESRPPNERIIEGLGEVREKLEDLLGVVGHGTLKPIEAQDSLEPSRKVRSLAARLNEELLKIANQDEAK